MARATALETDTLGGGGIFTTPRNEFINAELVGSPHDQATL